jgi:hypothetical protein
MRPGSAGLVSDELAVDDAPTPQHHCRPTQSVIKDVLSYGHVLGVGRII